jgi:uncharacterized protein (TIGR02246 family)
MTGQDGVKDAIAAVNRQFEAAFEQGNAGGVAALYTSTGQILPPNFEPMSGKEAIQGFWQGAMDMGIRGAQLKTAELEVHGETAIEVGQGTLLTEGGQVADIAKYIVVWRKENGEWRLHRDIWNSNRPAPG